MATSIRLAPEIAQGVICDIRDGTLRVRVVQPGNRATGARWTDKNKHE